MINFLFALPIILTGLLIYTIKSVIKKPYKNKTVDIMLVLCIIILLLISIGVIAFIISLTGFGNHDARLK